MKKSAVKKSAVKKSMWRIARISVLVIAALAILAPYIPAAFLRGRAEAALTRSLNRPVEIGDIRFTFFPAGPVPGPGFALENVTIHEDERIGIEPFAYVKELGASLRVLGLLKGRLDLSGLNLGEASVNLVKTEESGWNFQHLLNSLQEQKSSLPALRMRDGRVNFKFGDTKSVFFFREADLDISPSSDGAFDLRFSGAPSRTDHTKQDFGRLFVRGTSSPSNALNVQMELQRSSLEETLRLIDPQGFGVHGVLAINCHLAGELNNLQIAGNLEIGDVHRWDLLPESNQSWKLPFSGVLDLHDERLELRSTPATPSPLSVEFRAHNYLSKPTWSAGADFNNLPLATLLEVARHMGATLPGNLTIDGSASGSASYDGRNGLTGVLALKSASLQMPEKTPLQAKDAVLQVHDGSVYLSPATVTLPPSQSAQIEGSVTLAFPHVLDLRIGTRGLNVGAMDAFGLTPIPVLGESAQGTWRGWARYQNEKWTSESELRDGTLAVEGLADPISIASAAINLGVNRVAITKIKGSAGEIAFTGSYDFRGAQIPRLTLAIADADAEEIERLLAPALARSGRGFIARTLRLGSTPPPPAWLSARRADGEIAMDQLTAGEWKISGLKAAMHWEGTMISLSDISGSFDPGALSGALEISLAEPVPAYHFEGTVDDLPYHGGDLDLVGTADAKGSAAQLLETAHADGTVNGRNIAFTPDAEFHAISATFQLQAAGSSPRWKLSNVEANQDGIAMQGVGASQDDGRLLLELSQGDRSVRYVGPLFTVQEK